ncbi:sigma 54-interacting transcriptional regulator, partial [Vibrio parahaemolyticus]|nr:sigma 54-interacting transcriptional regulator [Vibrio parahaemolyticus]
ERKVRPIGTSKEIEVDVRVIAATHCNLMQQIKDGGFRADLFYRLNVFPITLPPLRARKSDIIPLAEHFVQHTTNTLGLPQAPGLSANVRKQLLAYQYPGNVRELKNIIERSVLLSDFETITHIEFGEQIPESVPSIDMKAASSTPEQPTYEQQAQADLEDVSKSLK